MMKLQIVTYACSLLTTMALFGCASGQGQVGATATLQAAAGVAQNAALQNPSLANKQAPEEFKVKFETTKGDFIVKVTRAWSPNGADRFYNLVDIGYFKDIVIFRAIDGFMFQFGIHGDPNVSAKWREANIKDDPFANVSNKPGYLSFAKSGLPNSRSTQIFINLGDNGRSLDGQGFTPFGQVVEGQKNVLSVNTEYGENASDVQGKFQSQGNSYILKKYPNLDIIKSVTFVTDDKTPKVPGQSGQPKE